MRDILLVLPKIHTWITSVATSNPKGPTKTNHLIRRRKNHLFRHHSISVMFSEHLIMTGTQRNQRSLPRPFFLEEMAASGGEGLTLILRKLVLAHLRTIEVFSDGHHVANFLIQNDKKSGIEVIFFVSHAKNE